MILKGITVVAGIEGEILLDIQRKTARQVAL